MGAHRAAAGGAPAHARAPVGSVRHAAARATLAGSRQRVPHAQRQQAAADNSTASTPASQQGSEHTTTTTTTTATSSSSRALARACSINATAPGLNAQGCRGLLAAGDIAPGQVVLRLPLHNALAVARARCSQGGRSAGGAAAAALLAAHQRQHGPLPHALAAFLSDDGAVWEAKLVAWLLHLRATAPPGSLWHAYIRALPAAADTLSFVAFSEQQAEQLQLGSWRALAHKQRQLLHTVMQQCSSGLWSGSSSCGSTQPSEADVAWALSMVKSRTFGQLVPLQPATTSEAAAAGSAAGHQDATSAATTQQQQQQQPAHPAAAMPAELQGAQGQQHQQHQQHQQQQHQQQQHEEEEDTRVVLLMAPYVDLINHAQDNNCGFGVDWQAQCLEVRCLGSISSAGTASGSAAPPQQQRGAAGIPAGREVTISYGSSKSNLALLASYGFQVWGNPNDALLLAPIFASCCGAAGEGDVQGFDAGVLGEAAAAVEAAAEGAAAEAGDGVAEAARLLGGAAAAAARRRCAVAAMPCAAHAAPGADAPTKQLQQQRYVAQLVLYQLQQMGRLCGSSLHDDATELLQLRGSLLAAAAGGARPAAAAAAAAVDDDGLPSTAVSAGAVHRQCLEARLEQKLLLRECVRLCEGVLAVIEARLLLEGQG